MPLKRQANGYLNKFETEWEAEQYIDKMLKRYKHHPNPSKYSIEQMVRESAEQGINSTAAFWVYRLKQKNITIREWPRNRKITKKPVLVTMDKDLNQYLGEYENKSYIITLGTKIITGWPVEEVIMFLPANSEGMWSSKVTIIFHFDPTKRVRAIISGDLQHRDEILIRSLLEKANHIGLEYIITFCETHGYQYLGGDLVAPTRFWTDVNTIELVDEHDSTILPN